MFSSTLLCGAWAQERVVSGTVTADEDGSLLPGVTILLKGTSTGTTTDLDGNWKLGVPTEGGTLVFSFVGMVNKEVEIGSRSIIDVSMTADATQLSEVVVQAYGSSSERLNTQQVETVQSESFQNFPIVSPQELLQGQAAGVQINSSSGLIGSAQVARIRGLTSFTSGNSPLYVIDGVPLNDGSGTANNDKYTNTAGAIPLNPLMDLNPNDIESISILKDAAATALYGSRGANGVILISTKGGELEQATQFNFDYFTGFNEPTVKKDVLNFEQWKTLRTELGDDPTGFPEDGFDWFDAVNRTGRVNSYSVSARGGNENTTYYVGGTYMNNSAYVIGNDLDKLNGRLNLTHQANNWLKLGTNISMSALKNDRISAENSTYSPWTAGLLNTPDEFPFDEEGNYQPAGFTNPMYLQQEIQFDLTTRRNIGNAFLEISPFKGFVFKTDWGMDFIQTEQEYREADIFKPGGLAYKEINQDNKWLTTNTLSYTKSFDSHTLAILAGQSFETARREDLYAESITFISDDLPNVGSGAEPTVASSKGTEWALYSLFGRINYNFSNRYILETSFRRDGSSRFGVDRRFGNFGAVSASWLISEENFFPNIDAVNFLKLSGSYGSSGNDRIKNFQSLGLYGSANYLGQSGIYLSQAANPVLTWETTNQMDVNLNAHFLKSRITMDLSFWKKSTNGILLDVPLPATTGIPGPSRSENVGKLVNQGIDLTINADIIDGGAFQWSTSFNIGFLNNEVTDLPETSTVDEYDVRYVDLSSYSNVRAIVGRSSQEFYLKRYLGVNPETGDAEWADQDGNPTTDYNAAPRVYAGSALPNATGGLTNRFSYKGFALSIFFNFVSGGKTYLADNEFIENVSASGDFNNLTKVLNSWTAENTDAYAPAYTSSTLSFWDNESTRHLYDASFIRLKNITFSYDVPRNMLEKASFLRSLRVYVMGQNLATFASELKDAGADPEVNSGGNDAGSAQGESFFASPQARQLTLGISLGL